MKKPKGNPESQPALDSTLIQFTKEFERLTKEITEIEKHSDNEQTLLSEARSIYVAVEKRTREVQSMNHRTLRERQVQLANIKEQLYNLTCSPGDCNSCEPMTSAQVNCRNC